MQKRFSIFEAVKFGFYTLIEHFGFFIGLILVYTASIFGFCLVIFPVFLLPFGNKILNIVRILRAAGVAHADVARTVVNQMGPEFSIVLGLLAFVVFCFYRFLTLGLTQIAFDFHDHNSSSIKRLFSCGHLVLKDALATIIYFLMFFIGLILFVVPGIYCAIAFGFYHQCIVDKHLGTFEALRKSRRLTKGAFFELFALSILLYFMRWLGLSLILTMFIVIPVITLIDVYVYRKLSETMAL
jgi:uncharacterized membrane protein